MKIEFDRNDFKRSEEFYGLIQNAFNLPEWFGKNADALWGALTGFVKTPCTITFKNFTQKENNYNERNINLILNCFVDAEKNIQINLLFYLNNSLQTNNH